MKLIFLGSFVNPIDESKYPNISVAGNKMQYNLLKNLSQKDLQMKIFSFEPHAKFPKEHKIIVLPSLKNLDKEKKIFYLPYINLPIVKELSLMISFWFALLFSISNDSVILSYNLFIYQAFAINFFKKRIRNKYVCLLADLSCGGIKKGLLGKFFRRCFDKYLYYSLKQCKYFIALNEFALKLYTSPEHYIIMDGGVEPSEYSTNRLMWDGKKKKILYSGALVDYSGVMNLIEAMSFVDSYDVELNIYGTGPLVNNILKKSEKNGKIKYCGSVPNSEMLKIQQKSWLLVNPRPVENDTAKVTFPSKIFEYMMSGRPVLSTHLNGFSKDYEELIYWIDDYSARGIASVINELDKKTDEELECKAKNAKNFMLKNKTWKKNADKVLDFLNTKVY